MLESGADINAKDKTAKTPLHLAAAKNKTETAIMLIEKGCALSPQDENGDTPLHVALTSASLEMIELLVEKGADIFLKNAKGKSSAASSIDIGDDEKTEIVKKTFFKAVNVVDEREFPLKQKFPHLTAISVCIFPPFLYPPSFPFLLLVSFLPLAFPLESFISLKFRPVIFI